MTSLLAWANVPFLVALGAAVTFALLQVTGILGLLAGGGHHDGDSDHDGSGDADADGDADGDHDADADGDHDADHDGDHDHDHGADHGAGHQILVDLGVGRVPMSIIWQTFAASFAFAGLAANMIYASRAGAVPLYSLAWTVPIALLFGYFITRAVSRGVGRMVADPRQEATSRKQLVGQSGIVISSKVNDEFGEVRLRDKSGHVLRVICRTRVGDKTIREGREVVIVDHDRDHDWLIVAPMDDDDDAPDALGAPPEEVARVALADEQKKMLAAQGEAEEAARAEEEARRLRAL
jgi:hypothetical protein